jgi:hypothetical protein
VQVNVDNVQVQPVPEIAVTVKFVGGSVTVTSPTVAAALAALETVIVYVPEWPGLTLPTLDTAAVRFGVVGAAGPDEVQPTAKRPATRAEIISARKTRFFVGRLSECIVVPLYTGEVRVTRRKTR